jgi:hypothetical protein
MEEWKKDCYELRVKRTNQEYWKSGMLEEWK